MCDVSLRVRLSCSRQNDSLRPRPDHATSSSQSNVRQLNSFSCRPSQRALDSGLCTPQYVHPCRLSNGKRHPVILQSCRVSRDPGTVHRGTRRVDRYRSRHRRSSMFRPSRANSAGPSSQTEESTSMGLLRSALGLEECKIGLCPFSPFPVSSCSILTGAIKAFRGT